MLLPRLALKIFSTQIAPILLYGTEVWAAYSSFNFSNCDKTRIERTHTQFLKRILGCDIHSPNQRERGPMVKHLLYNQRVLGSNPALGTLGIVSENLFLGSTQAM